jgi:uncharacterized cupin superfamily protein
MLVPCGTMPEPRSGRDLEEFGPGDQVDLGMLAGLRQFGAFVQTLAPGSMSSNRHWHSNEDEFLLVLDGAPTLIDDDGAQVLGPGDAVCWPHGEPMGHHIVNRSGGPARFLVAGTRVAHDVCTYPDSGQVLVNGDTDWRLLDGEGRVLHQGALPPVLRDLPEVWGDPPDPAAPRGCVLRAAERDWVEEPSFTHPALGRTLGPYAHAVLGEAGGLSQFGVHLERLPPGSASSFRHWHEAEDEMVHVLSGHPTLVEETETRLSPDDSACWPAGVPVGHHLVNRSDAPALYLTIGTRLGRDVIHYPDHDLITRKDGAARRYLHGDGSERRSLR